MQLTQRRPRNNSGVPDGGGQAGAADRVAGVRVPAPGAAGRRRQRGPARGALRPAHAAAAERGLPRAAPPPAVRAAARARPRARLRPRARARRQHRLRGAAGGVPARAGGAPRPPAAGAPPQPRQALITLPLTSLLLTQIMLHLRTYILEPHLSPTSFLDLIPELGYNTSNMVYGPSRYS